MARSHTLYFQVKRRFFMIKCFIKKDGKEYEVTGIDFKNQTIVYYNPDLSDYTFITSSVPQEAINNLLYKNVPLKGAVIRIENIELNFND
jgi:hypothetical protein